MQIEHVPDNWNSRALCPQESGQPVIGGDQEWDGCVVGALGLMMEIKSPQD